MKVQRVIKILAILPFIVLAGCSSDEDDKAKALPQQTEAVGTVEMKVSPETIHETQEDKTVSMQDVMQQPYELVLKRYDLNGDNLLNWNDAMTLITRVDEFSNKMFLDLNGTGDVDQSDGMIIAALLGSAEGMYGLMDHNEDGVVNLADYRMPNDQWGLLDSLLSSSDMKKAREFGWKGFVETIPQMSLAGILLKDKNDLHWNLILETPNLMLQRVSWDNLSEKEQSLYLVTLGVEAPENYRFWRVALHSTEEENLQKISVTEIYVNYQSVKASLMFTNQKMAEQGKDVIIGDSILIVIPDGDILPLSAIDMQDEPSGQHTSFLPKVLGALSDWLIPNVEASDVFTQGVDTATRAGVPAKQWERTSSNFRKEIVRLGKENKKAKEDMQNDPECRVVKCSGVDVAREKAAKMIGTANALAALMKHNLNYGQFWHKYLDDKDDLAKLSVAIQEKALLMTNSYLVILDGVSLDINSALSRFDMQGGELHQAVRTTGQGAGNQLGGKVSVGGIFNKGTLSEPELEIKVGEVEVDGSIKTKAGISRDVAKGMILALAQSIVNRYAEKAGKLLGGKKGANIAKHAEQLLYDSLSAVFLNPEAWKDGVFSPSSKLKAQMGGQIFLAAATAGMKAFLEPMKRELKNELKQYKQSVDETELERMKAISMRRMILSAERNVRKMTQLMTANTKALASSTTICKGATALNDCSARFAQAAASSMRHLRQDNEKISKELKDAITKVKGLNDELKESRKTAADIKAKTDGWKRDRKKAIRAVKLKITQVNNEIQSLYREEKKSREYIDFKIKKKIRDKEYERLKLYSELKRAKRIGNNRTQNRRLEKELFDAQVKSKGLLGKLEKADQNLLAAKESLDKRFKKARENAAHRISSYRKQLEACISDSLQGSSDASNTPTGSSRPSVSTPKHGRILARVGGVSSAATANITSAYDALKAARIYTEKDTNGSNCGQEEKPVAEKAEEAGSSESEEGKGCKPSKGNVAQCKKATPSSYYGGNVAARAVDGDSKTAWADSSYQGWIEVDLGQTYAIHKVGVVGHSQSDKKWNDHTNNYKVEYRLSKSDAWSLIGTGTTRQFTHPQDSFSLDNVKMRYIRYTSSGGTHWAHLNELRAFGKADESEFSYQSDFQGGDTSFWTHSNLSTDNKGKKVLGLFNNEHVQLRLKDVPAGNYKVKFDFYTLHTWDGNGENGYGPDFFSFLINGKQYINATFSTVGHSAISQSYSKSFPLGGAKKPNQTDNSGANLLHYSSSKGAVVNFRYSPEFTVNHPSGDLTLSFNGGVSQPGTIYLNFPDEVWTLDNVSVKAGAGKSSVHQTTTSADKEESTNDAKSKDQPIPAATPADSALAGDEGTELANPKEDENSDGTETTDTADPENQTFELIAPKESLEASVYKGIAPAEVQVKNWYCQIKQTELENLRNELEQSHLKYPRSMATAVLRFDKQLKPRDILFFHKLGLIDNWDKYKDGSFAINAPPGAELWNCLSKKELIELRKDLVRWAQYIIKTYGALASSDLKSKEKTERSVTSDGEHVIQEVKGRGKNIPNHYITSDGLKLLRTGDMYAIWEHEGTISLNQPASSSETSLVSLPSNGGCTFIETYTFKKFEGSADLMSGSKSSTSKSHMFTKVYHLPKGWVCKRITGGGKLMAPLPGGKAHHMIGFGPSVDRAVLDALAGASMFVGQHIVSDDQNYDNQGKNKQGMYSGIYSKSVTTGSSSLLIRKYRLIHSSIKKGPIKTMMGELPAGYFQVEVEVYVGQLAVDKKAEGSKLIIPNTHKLNVTFVEKEKSENNKAEPSQ